jgi:ribosomal protein L37AE/L43A
MPDSACRKSNDGSGIVSLSAWTIWKPARALWSSGTAIIKRGAVIATKIATLEERVTALEKQLARQPPEACPSCGEREMRRIQIGRMMGPPTNKVRTDWWRCAKCNATEERVVRF